jgi:hypothetical protein
MCVQTCAGQIADISDDVFPVEKQQDIEKLRIYSGCIALVIVQFGSETEEYRPEDVGKVIC